MAKGASPTRRILMIAGGLLALLIILAVVGRAFGLLGGPGEGMAVDTAKAQIRDVRQMVTASGRIQPEVEVSISPEISGEITYLGIREGQRVEKGDLLVRIRPDFYEAQFEQAKAGVAQAKANVSSAHADLIRAEQDYRRAKQLHEKQILPDSEFEAARSTYEVAQAQKEAAEYRVESALAQQTEAKENLLRTTIYAPMSGTVSRLNVELGERVVGTIQMAGTDMLRIALLEQMEVEADVNENDVVNISLNDTARIEVDAYPERTFRGIVTEIANSARIAAQGTQEQITNFPVKIRILDPHNVTQSLGAASITSEEVALPDESPQFRPGMSSTVDIYTDFVGDAVAVPIQGVTVRDFSGQKSDDDADDTESDKTEESEELDEAETSEEGGTFEGMRKEDLRRVVFVMDEEDGEARRVEVETGISDETHIQIKSGLEGGETVIIGPYSAVSRDLEDDQPVQKRQERSPRGRPE